MERCGGFLPAARRDVQFHTLRRRSEQYQAERGGGWVAALWTVAGGGRENRWHVVGCERDVGERDVPWDGCGAGAAAARIINGAWVKFNELTANFIRVTVPARVD